MICFEQVTEESFSETIFNSRRVITRYYPQVLFSRVYFSRNCHFLRKAIVSQLQNDSGQINLSGPPTTTPTLAPVEFSTLQNA